MEDIKTQEFEKEIKIKIKNESKLIKNGQKLSKKVFFDFSG